MKQFIRTGSYALILQNDRILFSRKMAGPHKDLWDLPGGGIEFSETPPSKRSTANSSKKPALKPPGPTLLTILSNHGEHRSPTDSYRYHHIAIIYRLTQIIPTTHPPEEQTRWFPISTLASQPITPFVQQLLNQKLLHGSIPQ